MNTYPAQFGFRYPAEWEPHEGTWIAWPHNRSDWPGKLGSVHWVYGEMVRRLVPGERVRILVNSIEHERRARSVLQRVGVPLQFVDFFRIPTNRGWTRDLGPLFVKRDQFPQELAVAHFKFNAWARYPDWQKDAMVPSRLAKRLGWRLFSVCEGTEKVVLEGGAIDVNGRGTLLTTEECLLDQKTQVRNPGYTKKHYEEIFAEALGATNVLWLGKGIAGDDTHGHIDDICRFVDPKTVVLCQEMHSTDVNYVPLLENRERLENVRLENGAKLDIVLLPMPAPLSFNGQRLPASYANFYISNSVVLVPTFNDPQDRLALGILGDLFKDRIVIGIHAVDLVWGLGTIHCLTQQQPAFSRMN